VSTHALVGAPESVATTRWALTSLGAAGFASLAAVRAHGHQLLVILLAVVYSACFAGIKAGLPFAPPLFSAGLRALVAGLALILLLAVWRRPLLPSRASWCWVIALGFTSTTLALGAMYLSPGHAGAGVASVLGNLQPVVVLALAAPVLGERITVGKAAALGLGFSGVLLISFSMLGGSDSSDVFGPLLALLASLSVATGNVLAKRMGAQPHLVAIAAWQLVVGSLPLLASSVLLESGLPVHWDPQFILILLFLALGVTALPTPIWYWLVRDNNDLGKLTLFLLLVPAFGLALGVALFGETLGTGEIIGTGVILAGVATAARAEATAPVGHRLVTMPCHCPSLLCVEDPVESSPVVGARDESTRPVEFPVVFSFPAQCVTTPAASLETHQFQWCRLPDVGTAPDLGSRTEEDSGDRQTGKCAISVAREGVSNGEAVGFKATAILVYRRADSERGNGAAAALACQSAGQNERHHRY
jgi:drug/metabolite transporter (DMT)-like permease